MLIYIYIYIYIYISRCTQQGGTRRNLQSGIDRQGPWRSWELWKPWRCRELRRPWWSWELWWPWRSWQLWRPWRMVFGGLGLGPLGPAPTAGTLTTPPKKKFPGEVRGYQEPSGAKQTGQYKTRQESPPGPDRQDRTAHRNRKPSRASSEAEASSGHDQESEAHTGSLSDRLHFSDKGAGG